MNVSNEFLSLSLNKPIIEPPSEEKCVGFSQQEGQHLQRRFYNRDDPAIEFGAHLRVHRRVIGNFRLRARPAFRTRVWFPDKIGDAGSFYRAVIERDNTNPSSLLKYSAHSRRAWVQSSCADLERASRRASATTAASHFQKVWIELEGNWSIPDEEAYRSVSRNAVGFAARLCGDHGAPLCEFLEAQSQSEIIGNQVWRSGQAQSKARIRTWHSSGCIPPPRAAADFRKSRSHHHRVCECNANPDGRRSVLQRGDRGLQR